MTDPQSFLSGRVSLHAGDCLEVLRTIPDASLDSCCCDPPYHLTSIVKRFGADKAAPCKEGKTGAYARSSRGFMGQTWDGGDIAFRVELWAEVLRVLKPGGYVVAFSGTRTYHRMACAIEDAGFDIRDQLGWVYGCLDEATSVVSANGVVPHHSLSVGSMVLCYDVSLQAYSFQPVLEIVEYDYDDTAFRLVGDAREQVVSRSHRCIIERGGMEQFERAETLEHETSVPFLESLSDLQRALRDTQQIASGEEQDVRPDVFGSADRNETEGSDDPLGGKEGPDDLMRGLRNTGLETGRLAKEGSAPDLLAKMQRGAAGRGVREAWAQRPGGLDAGERSNLGQAVFRAGKSGLEGRRDISAVPRESCWGALRAVSGDLSADVTEGRIRDGASARRSEGDWSSIASDGGRAPHQPQVAGKPVRESDVVPDERGAQSVRAWGGHRASLVRVVPFHLTGKVWCLRVPTGAFVAVRGGVAFPTGNSGFPKSLDISKAIDKAGGMSPREQASLLKVSRERADLSRDSLATSIGCSVSSIRDWEEGRARAAGSPLEWIVPSEEYRLRLAEVLGYSADQRVAIGAVCDRRADGSIYAIGHSGNLKSGSHSSLAKQWQGWGTALKPAWEPICLARKPLIGTNVENVLAFGTGALNIDGCRVGDEVRHAAFTSLAPCSGNRLGDAGTAEARRGTQGAAKEYVGRFPANILHDGSDEVLAAFPNAPGQQRTVGPQHGDKSSVNVFGDYGARDLRNPRGDSGSAARFFYSAKADADDRIGSSHPTVKPVDLMQYLVRLVTPKGGTVLDCFAGTGTTGEAAWREGMNAVLIEREEAYRVDIARRMALCLAGPDDRARASIKARHGDLPAGPLFDLREVV